MPTDLRSQTSSGGHRVLRRAAKVSLTTALVLVLFVVCMTVLFAHCSLNFNLSTRNHLKEIPVARSACPYVRALHNIADDVQRNEPLPVFVLAAADPTTNMPLAWPKPSRVRSQRFGDALYALDLEITLSNPHFPPRVRKYLSATQRAGRRGRIEITHTYYGFLAAQPSTGLLDAGVQAFGYASDLVGKQCGVSLQADSSSMPDTPFIIVPAPSPKPKRHAPTTTEPGASGPILESGSG